MGLFSKGDLMCMAGLRVKERKFSDLEPSDFPDVDPSEFYEWKETAQRAWRNAWIYLGIYTVMGLAIVVATMGVFVPPGLIIGLVALYFINRKSALLSKRLGITKELVVSALREGTPVRTSPTTQASRVRMKKCPACAEEIRFEAKVCRFCSYKFDELIVEKEIERLKAEEADRLQGRQEAEAKFHQQMFLYHGSCRLRNVGYIIYVISIFSLLFYGTIGIVAFSYGEAPSSWGKVILMTLVFVVFAGALWIAGGRVLLASKKRLRELEERVAKDGNYYCCSCSNPKKKYYWLHYIFCIVLFPYGLISLFFVLKKCRNCGRPYKPFLLHSSLPNTS